METKTDASYGVIPIRRVGESWEVFVIHQFSRIGNNSYWVFPKGHPIGQETPKQTALRELKEETGMEVKTLIDKPTFNLNYNFTFDGVNINKEVRFFVGEVSGDMYKLCKDEVKEAGWYSLSDAAERLDYQDTKHMFTEARAFLEDYK